MRKEEGKIYLEPTHSFCCNPQRSKVQFGEIIYFPATCSLKMDDVKVFYRDVIVMYERGHRLCSIQELHKIEKLNSENNQPR